MKSYPDAEFHVHWYYDYRVQQEKEVEKEKHGQNGKFGQKEYYSAQFGIQLSFDMHCAVKSFKVRIPNEYKYHGSPYIQGTVPCDMALL